VIVVERSPDPVGKQTFLRTAREEPLRTLAKDRTYPERFAARLESDLSIAK
jgi:hypothetical protein